MAAVHLQSASPRLLRLPGPVHRHCRRLQPPQALLPHRLSLPVELLNLLSLCK